MALQSLIYNTTDTTKQKNTYQVRKSSLFLLFTLSSMLVGCGGDSGLGGLPTNITPPNTNPTVSPANTWLAVDTSSTGVSGHLPIGMNRHKQDVYLTYNELSNKNLLKTQDGITFTEFSMPNRSTVLEFIDESGLMYFSGISEPTYTSFDAINLTQITNDDLKGSGSLTKGSPNILMSIYTFNIDDKTNIYISTDGAVNWSETDLNGDLTIDDSDKVLVGVKPAFNGNNTFAFSGSPGGLLISQDSGSTWNSALATEGIFFAVAGNSEFPNNFFAAKAGKIFRSDDSATTWVEISSPLINGQPIVEFRALELLDDGTLLSWGLANNAGQNLGQVFKSTDFGSTWIPIGNPIGLSASTFAFNNGTVNLTANDRYYFLRSEVTVYRLAR